MPRTRPVPTRTCVVCGTARPKRELYRIVRTPDGAVRYDPTGRQNGRGAYLCGDEACLAGAVPKLSRALEADVPGEVVEDVRRQRESIPR